MYFFNKLISAYQDPSNKDIDGELVNLLYTQARSSISASLFVATFIVVVLYNVIPNKFLLSWYGLMLCVTLFRLAMAKFYFIRNPSLEKRQFWYKIFILTTCLAGIVWSLAGTLLIPTDVRYQMFIGCMYAGISGGAVPFFSASRTVCAAYLIPMLTPFSIWLLWQGDYPHVALGIFVIVYLVMLIISSFKTHKVIYNAIKLQFENSALVKRLSISNDELESEITERKMTEKLLRNSEEQYRLVTDALPVLISYIDTQFHYRFNNKAHEAWFGKSLDEITGKAVKHILDDTNYAVFVENFGKLAGKKQISYETMMHFHNEEDRYVSVTLIPHVTDQKMNGLFSLISDMTPRLNYLATHDTLTDLPNRNLFKVHFSRALKRAVHYQHSIALLFLDLDHFKNINDTLGHNIGDYLLIKVVERIKGCLRELDTLARLGGDEFIIILEEQSVEDIVFIANKICFAFSTPFHVENHSIFITTSIGISLYPEDGIDMEILLKNADMAIYRAKERGRNTFEFYTAELNEKITKKRTIETNLRSAIEKQEFQIFYQPIIHVEENKVCGFESLIRWNHSEIGEITPDQFIPVAEEIGFIIPLGEWVLHTVCSQNKIWQKDNYFLSKTLTSINISARQFKEKQLVKKIKSLLKEIELSGETLTLELTETVIMEDIEYSSKIIKSLKDLGFSISIDDFGTGYSSLNYLRKFPIDFLKIDRSFITDITTNAEDESIVKAIIAMAHSLKIKVVAEGVETIGQYELLKKYQCNEIQGYLFSKPLSVSEASLFLLNPDSAENALKEAYHSRGC